MSYVRLKDIGDGHVGVKSATAVSEEDLSILSGDDFAGQRITADDVCVRRMFLCTDQYDRSYERFPKAYLEQFSSTIPGKSVLANHNSRGDQLPISRFFSAGLTSKIEEYPVPVGGRELPSWWFGGDEDEDAAPEPDGTKAESIPNFEGKRVKVTYLDCKFFFANDPSNDSFKKNIDLGIYKHVSIGFSYDDLNCDLCGKSYFKGDCRHIIGYLDKEGKLATGTYAGDAKKSEALEGSIVYLGCQPRARLVKQIQTGEVDVRVMSHTPYGEDLVALKEAEHLARIYGYKSNVWSFPHLEPSGINGETVNIPYTAVATASTSDITLSLPPSQIAGVHVSLPLGGKRFEDELEAALGAVERVITRAEDLRSKREAKGGRISAERMADLSSLQERLDTLKQSAPVEPTETETEVILALQAEHLRIQSQHRKTLLKDT